MSERSFTCARWLTSIAMCVGVVQPSLAEDVSAVKSAPVGTAISYQGRLPGDGSSATGVYDLRLSMYDASTGGSQAGGEIVVEDAEVADGVVSVEVDFGDLSLFAGEARWLEIAIRPGASTGGFAVLSPRQRLNPTPFALSAQLLGSRDESYFVNTGGGLQTISGSLRVEGGAVLESSSADSYGVEAFGARGGGSFHDGDGSGRAFCGWNDVGVVGYGSLGGFFAETSGTGAVYCGFDETGVLAEGGYAAGSFDETDTTANALLASDGAGIRASGPAAGGAFADSDQSGVAEVGAGDLGIDARGTSGGGHFVDLDDSGEAWLGYANVGIRAQGDAAGGYFRDADASGAAWAAYMDYGIWAGGDEGGGLFVDSLDDDYAVVAKGSYKVTGNGQVSFIQNHPKDPGRVIVYTALEGDEAGTYTRGTARLENGVATVTLGETFRWVTNPDIGLTVHLTPRGEWSDLYVVSVTTSKLEVASHQGAPDAAFDFIVYGLRIGFEETSVVQEKRRESPIPSMSDHQDLYRARPELKQYSSLDRFSAMRVGLGDGTPLDLSAAEALCDEIGASVSDELSPER